MNVTASVFKSSSQGFLDLYCRYSAKSTIRETHNKGMWGAQRRYSMTLQKGVEEDLSEKLKSLIEILKDS